MKIVDDRGTLVPQKDGWVLCPHCNQKKILKINSDSSAKNLPCYCNLCRRTVIITIHN